MLLIGNTNTTQDGHCTVNDPYLIDSQENGLHYIATSLHVLFYEVAIRPAVFGLILG